MPQGTAEYFRQLDDESFDSVYPESVRQQSHGHWTPVAVCRRAAKMLDIQEGTRVLDIGCGPGKFCAIGAATTSGTFTGIEQREPLVWAANDMLAAYKIERVKILHANVTDVSFADFDAFYIYNPFQEHVIRSLRIDSDVSLDANLYQHYSDYVKAQLELAPLATRVVTFWGECLEIPMSYNCERSAFGAKLKLWVKRA